MVKNLLLGLYLLEKLSILDRNLQLKIIKLRKTIFFAKKSLNILSGKVFFNFNENILYRKFEY